MFTRANIRIFLAAVFMVLWMPGVQSGAGFGPTEIHAAPLPNDGVIVYQFHRRFRCDACHILEEAISETLKTHFSRELETGDVVVRVIDLDAEGNERYSETYDFFYNTVIIVDMENGKETRFKNLEEVWDLTEDKDAVIEFIKSHIEEYL